MSNEVLFLVITVFFARLSDMTLRTMRTILLIEGRKYLAAILGFFEVSIWLLVIRNAITSTEGVLYIALAYGSGFALGHILGLTIVERIVKQINKVIIITTSSNDALVKALRNNNFGVTKIEATGINETEKYFLYLEIMASRIDTLNQVLAHYDPQAFMIINKSKDAINGHFD